MFDLMTMLGYGREQLMVAALASLAVAGAVVTLGAWVLLFRQRQRGRAEPVPAPPPTSALETPQAGETKEGEP